MAPFVKISNQIIGSGHPVFIMAEAGVNNHGDLETARKLILAAKDAGADCVKFQTFKAERCVTFSAPKARYQLNTSDPRESQLEMLRNLELESDGYVDLMETCRRHGILFMSTPYNRPDVDFLDELGVSAFKTASIHIAEPSFLRYVASKGKPMIVSTGMATLAEVDKAVRAIRNAGNDRIVLLHCTTDYPAKIEEANLLAMRTMAQSFNLPIGYSDHTQSDLACLLSIGSGAVAIEKHFTLDKSMPGPDQAGSADPEEFKKLVDTIRLSEKALGNGVKQPTSGERANMPGMRRGLVAGRDISRDETLTEEMVTLKRPAQGIAPKEYDRVIGLRAKVDIKADAPLEWWMLDES